MGIPKIIHQTWKTNKIPRKWHSFSQKVKDLNPEWEYRLWSDADNDQFVKDEYPELWEIFKGFSKGIMRADVIRYLIMYKIGGVYLDLDYEVLQAFDFEDHSLVLPKNRSKSYGDEHDGLGNCIFASVPGHRYWADVISDLKIKPPVVDNYSQIVEATGPGFLTRIYNNHNYEDIYLPERLIYHPPTPSRSKSAEKIRSNGVSVGIHHPWGSWKERWTLIYAKNKLKKWIS